MKDQKVLAYCNLFGVLGAIPTLLEMDPEAKKLVKHSKISLGFLVKDGPSATLRFCKGKAEMTPGVKRCSIKLNFDSCKGFNDMIDGDGKPKLSGGIWHALFLLKKFTKLTDILSKYLRPTEKDLEDPEFFERSTTLMLHVIAGAIADGIIEYLKRLDEMTIKSSTAETAQPSVESSKTPTTEVTPEDQTTLNKGYTIQLMASATELTISESRFGKLSSKVAEYIGAGSYKYKYCYSRYATSAEAKAELSTVQATFKDAYIVLFEGNSLK